MQKFESLREMRMLPGFVEKVRRGRHRFKTIVGWYQLPDTIPCSIADCGTPHNRGYVVAIQSGGAVGHTNIGHVCGRNEFGEAFERAHVAAEKFLDQQRLKQSIADTLEELPEIEARARVLLSDPRGALWFRRALGSFVHACPVVVYEDLVRRAGRGEAVISRSRNRTEKDPPGPDGTHRGYVTETVGVIAGLGCFTAPRPLDLLNDHVLKPLTEFSRLSADEVLGKTPTRRWFQAWRKRLPGEFEAVERKLEQARSFFSDANLQQLAHLATSTEERTRLGAIRWDEEQGVIHGFGPSGSVADERRAVPVERRVVSIDKYGMKAARDRVHGWKRKRKKKGRGGPRQ